MRVVWSVSVYPLQIILRDGLLIHESPSPIHGDKLCSSPPSVIVADHSTFVPAGSSTSYPASWLQIVCLCHWSVVVPGQISWDLNIYGN